MTDLEHSLAATLDTNCFLQRQSTPWTGKGRSTKEESAPSISDAGLSHYFLLAAHMRYGEALWEVGNTQQHQPGREFAVFARWL